MMVFFGIEMNLYVSISMQYTAFKRLLNMENCDIYFYNCFITKLSKNEFLLEQWKPLP